VRSVVFPAGKFFEFSVPQTTEPVTAGTGVQQ
jgi:hypothetical protein